MATAKTITEAVNPIPTWVTDPLKSAAKVMTSVSMSGVKIFVNVEAMIPLTEETTRKVVEARKVIDLL